MRASTIFLFAAILLTACPPAAGAPDMAESVREHAALDFRCTHDQVVVQPASGTSSYRASGCQREALYDCVTSGSQVACVFVGDAGN